MIEQLAILGSGPAGLTAAIYAARAGIGPIVCEGMQPGGQLTLTSDVENFPGFAEAIVGQDLMARFRAQAERFGTRFVFGAVERIESVEGGFRLVGTDIVARAVIVATGASAKWTQVPGEQEFLGRGVSACATCDGFFFKNKDIAVIGGGDTALEEATFLTRFAQSVTLVHRRDTFRASKAMQEKAFANPKIKYMWNAVPESIIGDQKVEALKVNVGGVSQVIPVQGVFIAIGHTPNTACVRELIACDAAGYIVNETGSTRTSVPGIFAAGDVADHRYRQAITAAGSGCMAALDAEAYLGA